MTEYKRSENYEEQAIRNNKTIGPIGELVKLIDKKSVRIIVMILVITFFMFRIYMQ